jgi:cell division ATPase FtsA
MHSDGRCAGLEGMAELANRFLISFRTGTPGGRRFVDVVRSPMYATGVGLVVSAAIWLRHIDPAG